jgi:hypothetical protein
MTTPAPSAADIRAALEDLRTADRILLSVQGTTQFLKRQQFLDTLGIATGDGYFGGETVRDNNHANEELMAAQQAMTDATRRLGLANIEPETLVVWGRLDEIFDGAWSDFLALQQARANQEVAGRVRGRVRALFARACELHPEVAAGVAPLADEAIEDDDLRPARDWQKLGMYVALAIAAVAAVAML